MARAGRPGDLRGQGHRSAAPDQRFADGRGGGHGGGRGGPNAAAGGHHHARGGSLSVTNIGSVGGLFSFPIINVPEAAILGVHAIRKRAVVLPDDTIATRFTNQLIDLLQAPEAMLLDA